MACWLAFPPSLPPRLHALCCCRVGDPLEEPAGLWFEAVGGWDNHAPEAEEAWEAQQAQQQAAAPRQQHAAAQRTAATPEQQAALQRKTAAGKQQQPPGGPKRHRLAKAGDKPPAHASWDVELTEEAEAAAAAEGAPPLLPPPHDEGRPGAAQPPRPPTANGRMQRQPSGEAAAGGKQEGRKPAWRLVEPSQQQQQQLESEGAAAPRLARLASQQLSSQGPPLLQLEPLQQQASQPQSPSPSEVFPDDSDLEEEAVEGPAGAAAPAQEARAADDVAAAAAIQEVFEGATLLAEAGVQGPAAGQAEEEALEDDSDMAEAGGAAGEEAEAEGPAAPPAPAAAPAATAPAPAPAAARAATVDEAEWEWRHVNRSWRLPGHKWTTQGDIAGPPPRGERTLAVRARGRACCSGMAASCRLVCASRVPARPPVPSPRVQTSALPLWCPFPLHPQVLSTIIPYPARYHHVTSEYAARMLGGWVGAVGAAQHAAGQLLSTGTACVGQMQEGSGTQAHAMLTGCTAYFVSMPFVTCRRRMPCFRDAPPTL